MITVHAYGLNGFPDNTVIQVVSSPYAEKHLVNPSCKIGMESSGSFEFSIQPDDMYYNAFQQITTKISVQYDNVVIFYGRVLTINDGFYGEKKITCEGAISFLLDSWYPPQDENDRKKITVFEYLTALISNHNQQIDSDTYKYFYIGEVPGNYSQAIESIQMVENAEEKFGESSWKQTKSVIDDLKSHYGGCWRTRYIPYNDYYSDIGQFGRGNIDLNNRIVIQNPDGSISTERSFSVNIDGKEVLLPTIINGEIRSEDYAIEYYNQTGEYLGKFDSVAEAEAYAVRLHERQEWYYSGQPLTPRVAIYLDWIDQYFTTETNTQSIAIGENIIDASKASEVDNIFTVVIPVGKNNNKELYVDGYETDIHGSGKEIQIPDLLNYFTEAELNEGYHNIVDYRDAITKYGRIVKVVTFDDKDSKEELFKAAMKWIKDNYYGGVDSFTVKAIDMHLLDGTIEQINVGDRVNVQFPEVETPGEGSVHITRLLTCLEIDYDLYNPQNNSYTFGIPSMALTKNYRTNGKSVKSKSSDGGGYTKPETPDLRTDQEKWFDGVINYISKKQVWYKSNGNKQGGPSTSDGSPPYILRLSINMSEDGEHAKRLLWKPIWENKWAKRSVKHLDEEWDWRRDAKGRPDGSWVEIDYKNVTWTTIESYRIPQYVKDEYGYDLRTDGATPMPGVLVDENGNTSIISGLLGVDIGGNINFLSGLGDGEAAGVIGKIAEIITGNKGTGFDVISLFNGDGINVAKLLGDDGTILFAEIDDEGKVVIDPETGEPVYINIRDIRRTTDDLVSGLEALGVTVSGLNDDVTIIGQTLGDTTYGLIFDVASMGYTVALISNDMVIIGQYVDSSLADMTYSLIAMGVTVTDISTDVVNIGQKVDSSLAGLTYDLAYLGVTVTNITTDVVNIGQKVDSSISGLTYDLAEMGKTVTNITSDVVNIGQKVDSSIADLTYGLAEMGKTVTNISTDVVNIGQKVDSSISGLTYDLAEMGKTVTNITSDVVNIGQKVDSSVAGLTYDITQMGKTVTNITSDVINIGDKLDSSVASLTYDLVQQGYTVTNINSDVVNVKGRLNAAEARIGSLETDYLKTDELESHIAEISVVRAKAVSISESYGYIMAPTYYIGTLGNAKSFENVIVSASVDTSTNTLTLNPLIGDPITFSKAASTTKVSGSWSGGVLTVSADASGEDSYQRYFKAGTITWASDKKHVTVYGDVYKQSGQSEYKTDSDAFNLYVDTTASYNAGRNFYLYSAGWSSTGKLTIGAKDGATDDVISGKTIERTVTGGTPTWDGGTVTVPIRAYYGNTPPTYEDTNASISLNLSIDNNGNNNNSVKLKYGSTDTGYTFTHGKYTAGQKSVTPSISWPTGWTITASNPYDSTKTNSIGISMSHGSDSTGHYIELHSNETSSPLKAKKTIALDMGSVSSGSRTVKVKFDGSDILTSTINDYKNGQDSVHPTLSGSWSSGILTVSSSPSASDNYVRTLSQGTASWNGATVSVPINATYGNSGQYSESTGKSVSVDVSGKLQSKTFSTKGTYTPDSGYIGFSSVTVNASATPTLSGSWSSGTLTVSSDPAASENYVRTLSQGAASWSGTTVTLPINAVYGSSGQYSESTGLNVSVDVSSKLTTKSATSNGDVTPGSGYIGLSKVTVNVKPSLSGSWSSGTLTVSSTPTASENYKRTLSKGTVTWSGNTATIPINATYGSSGQYSESTGWSTTVDASGRYTQGWSDGYNTFDTTGTTASGEIAYGGTATVTVKQKDSGGTIRTRLSRTYTGKADRYSTGWSDGYNTFDTTGTTASGEIAYGGTATVTVKQKDSGGTVRTRLSRTYTGKADRYSTGWSDGYNTFDTTGTTASGTLSYGGTATVTVKQKDSGGTVRTRLSRTYTSQADRWTEGRDFGWGTAVQKFSIPGPNYDASRSWFSFSYPIATPFDRSDTAYYDISASSGTAKLTLRANGQTVCSCSYSTSVPASNVDLNSWQYSTGKPAQVDTYTELTTLRNYMINYSRGYIYFKAGGTGISGSKWYRIQTVN